ncbi:ABC transporter ATP-binding protein [Streptomyces candidus]|uniref:ATP-binding cassette subfamily B protein n=1 Tax=Streptomyces candidus TaxID=67283 RepID=A0A7X0HDY5_9ACTN|nr:ABC transporter ATP-binding protein [Streptomyces candidus]MBB6435860.1 ATP-binding cassette subfamily B protein [Streptomyces candidus]GHH42738.1 ABC transporter ATP-binding protein [Streptomyces candidus]
MRNPDRTRKHLSSPADTLLLAVARRNKGRAAGVFTASALSACAAVALPAVVGRTLDLLLARDPAARGWLVLCAALVAAEMLLEALEALFTGTAQARSTAWLRTRAVSRLLGCAPRDAAHFPPGDTATRLSANATEAGAAPGAAAALVAALIAPVGALVALALVDPWCALAFAAGLPLLLLVLRAFAVGSSDSVARYQQVQSTLASLLTEALAGARSIAAAGTVERDRARILAPLPELGVQGRRMWSVHGRAVARSGVLLPLLTTVVVLVGGLGVVSGRVSVGELLAASRYAALAAGIGAVAGLLGTLVRSRTAARRMSGILTLPGLTHGERVLPPDGPGTLQLRGVDVVQDGKPLLKDVSLTLPGGTTTAVVGRSGAGKSTLAAVAGRLCDPDAGSVLLDGVPLRELGVRQLRDEVTYAFERPALFGDTLAEALASGARTASSDEVRAAARAAGADDFVRLLPLGYETAPGDAPLSGGEFQRLGLARAFAHAGRLLILDDATSSLDTATERRVEEALARDVGPGTRLCVAHRLSSAARADQVVWLDGGRVRAVGPHRELWEQDAYREVFAVDDGPGPRRSATAPGERR